MKKLHWIKGNHLELAFPLTIVNFSESGKTSSNYDVSSDGFSVEVILQGMFSRKKINPKVVNGNVLRIVDEGTLDVDTYSVEIVVKEPNGTDVDTLRRSKWNHVLQVHDSNEKVVEQFDDFPDYAEGAIIEGSVFFFVGGSIGGSNNAPIPMPDLSEIEAKLEVMQDAISDLETIREGAALGATAVQKMKVVSLKTNADTRTMIYPQDSEYYIIDGLASELYIFLPDTYSEVNGEQFIINVHLSNAPRINFVPGGGYGGNIYATGDLSISPYGWYEIVVKRVSNTEWIVSANSINPSAIKTITPSGSPQAISEDEEILDTTE